MSNEYRLSSGDQINRSESISFKFNGKTLYGYKGDTLASALLANGIHLVGRSFKYHRPRGILTSGVEEPNALVQIVKDKGKTDPNLRATQIEIYEGLNASSQNSWPSVNFDLGSINNLFSPIIPAGFYYNLCWKNLNFHQNLVSHQLKALFFSAFKAVFAATNPAGPAPTIRTSQ